MLPTQVLRWVLALIWLPTVVSAQDAVDNAVTPLLKSQHVPGAAIAAVKDGKVLKEIVYGEANLQMHVPVRRTTKFQLASVTKVFTAAALMKLEENGKLNLDHPISKYLDRLPDSWLDVKVRELASHTSGLPDLVANPNQPLTEEELNRTAEEALKFSQSREPIGPPGDRFQYDQTNYLLLERIIQRVSGQSFRNFVIASVMQASMPATSWGDGRAIVPDRSDMYTELYHDRIENGANLYAYPEYLDAAAGLNSNIADMERFAVLLTSGQVLPRAELDRMWEPAKNRKGNVIDIAKDMDIKGVVAPAIGWFYADNSGGEYPRVFMAGGSATSIVLFPKQDLCIVVLTNLQAKDDPLPIAERLAKEYLPELKPMF
jgi:CubicO group peptidase (beta-lactamase class C family)